jgi:hypothetical protein
VVPQNASAVTVASAGRAEHAVAVAGSDIPSLSTILAKLPEGTAFLGSGLQTGIAGVGGALPPVPPKFGKKWVPQPGDEIPSDPNAYFPMIGFK